MKQTKYLINTCSEKYKRAFTELTNFSKENINLFDINNIENLDFKSFRGALYSFFDLHSIFISAYPHNTSNHKKRYWMYLICLDDTEILEGNYQNRESAEYIAFLKAFQFLDTKLFIEQTKDRFIDETSDISCVNMNWSQLNKVLSYKRKHLLI